MEDLLFLQGRQLKCSHVCFPNRENTFLLEWMTNDKAGKNIFTEFPPLKFVYSD